MPKSKARILTKKEVQTEDFEYFLGLTPKERLRELNKLRILNYGEKAMAPMAKKIEVMPIND